VAADIARALGGFTRHDDYYESDKFVLSSAVGHLLEIGMPEDEEVKRGKWTFAHLPAIPSRFDLKPIEKNANRLRVLLKLIKRKDVTQLINACDAGREGELIFRYIVQYSHSDKPVHRLWLQSMTPAAIRDGFARLRTDETMQPLADAAVCRSESDWLVGINGTRAMTAFNSKSGGFQLTTVGRVQTPTLAILVEREERIRGFVPRDYWELHGTFRATAGEYAGRWFDESFARRDDDPDLRAERLWDREKAESIARKCAGKPGEVSEESRPSTQIAPLLYDLTSLQREANGRFGFSARTTLSLAQALYEKHKALTYPRTDSRALPEDYQDTVRATLEELKETNAYGNFAREILKQKWVRPNKRIFDNAKVSDHFAIIPTLVRPKHLSEIEAKLYDMVVKRFLAVFYPAAEYLITTRITRVEGEPFKSEGKVLVNPGWLAVYGRDAAGEDPTLTPVKVREVTGAGRQQAPTDERATKSADGASTSTTTRRFVGAETVATQKIDVVALTTRPPPRFNEATLLSAMEGAGKLIEDDELREAMREKGLGTPATRAQIIEGLIQERYILREGKELVPTPKAFSLLTLLHGLGVPELFSPELTAEWEFKLAQMEHGKLSRRAFMREIVDMTKHIVAQAKNYESDTIPGDFATLEVRCPKCGGEVHEKYKKFQCIEPDCDFAFWKILGGRQLGPDEAETLIREREIGPLDGFRSRQGRPFSAKLKLNDANEVEFDFGPRLDSDDGAIDFSGQTPLGPCPKCGNNVFETPNAYVCERAVGETRSCDFRSGRTILQRPIERPQMQKLLAEGKTDLLQFVSARTRRPFSAYLVKQKDGKVGFEFEAKAPGARGARPQRGGAPARVLGPHPRDKQPVELHAGRYGPYVKHGGINATLPERDKMETLTLAEAVVILDAKAGRAPTPARTSPATRERATVTDAVAARSVRTSTSRATGARTKRGETARAPTAQKTATRKPASTKTTARTKPKPRAIAKRKGTTARQKKAR
jgi:DNA topoisomerase-3